MPRREGGCQPRNAPPCLTFSPFAIYRTRRCGSVFPPRGKPLLRGRMRTGSAGSHRVLVVDDEPHIGRIIQLQLESGPYEVDLVSDGTTALEKIRSEQPLDLILLDIMLPGMSGLDLLEQLRGLPHRRDTPVIMLTAKGQSTDRERAGKLGATDFLTKPFSPRKLLARIDELFDD